VADDPPAFVRLAAHPVRWRLLRELVRSDRAVRELTMLVDEPQSLVSYHSRQLRDGGLVSVRRSSADRRHPGRSRHRRRVLFLCTGNSARSQMAEALVEQMSAGAIEAATAGSHPKPLHPKAVRVLRKRGIDISANRTKHLDEFVSQRFDTVITLCDRVREVCPEFPSHPELVHWSVPDPTLESASNLASYPAFE
jgi:ArsR family transcriptional regulator, arsenate/arsenite/antimonite-responsive transcriptional repressor / arsenate reductase (thioredoxin)